MHIRRATLSVGAALLLAGSLHPDTPLISEAQAIVGRPVTPVSVAGVARRTAYRTTVAAGTTAAAASQQQAAAAQQEAAAAQQQAETAQRAAKQALPIGTTVAALPSGCSSRKIGGDDYFDCGGIYYQAAFQSNNVVYVVSDP